jgi:hypothetical protein
VVQALARAGLLKQFHYLSTVSGGGYTGAWLTTQLQAKSASDVEKMLTRSTKGEVEGPVRQLRGSTNFLTPDPALFSLDTWSSAVLWLRNFLLTWLGMLPLFLAGVLGGCRWRGWRCRWGWCCWRRRRSGFACCCPATGPWREARGSSRR